MRHSGPRHFAEHGRGCAACFHNFLLRRLSSTSSSTRCSQTPNTGKISSSAVRLAHSQIRGADTLVTRAPRVVGQFEATVGVLGAFGVSSGHSPFAILSLPACVSRSPPDNSCMYPSLISRSLCSAGIARCIKPLAQSRNETNSSWVNGGAGAIPRISAGFPSGRLTSSNVAT